MHLENKKIHRNSNLFQRKSLNSFRVILFLSSILLPGLFNCLFISVSFSRGRQKTFSSSSLKMNHGWQAGTAIKIYLYKMMRSHNEFRKIFGFLLLLLMFLLEWNPMKTCSILEFGKRTHHNAGNGGDGSKRRLILSLDFQLAIFISYRKPILHSALLITETNKYRSKFIVVVFLSHSLSAILPLRVCVCVCLFALVMAILDDCD